VTSTRLARVVALAAIAITYFFCLRPHLPGRRRDVESQDENPTVDRQLTELRDELQALRRTSRRHLISAVRHS
jgi:hypothetical protein